MPSAVMFFLAMRLYTFKFGSTQNNNFCVCACVTIKLQQNKAKSLKTHLGFCLN